ncbi:MAG TPA: RNA polymerase sigma factor, partial [Candidatus Binatia bacterium]|nr:RNA polymerase sigma factor [Candidatus Binatia bacterium]
ATQTETEDLLADIWADCVPGDAEQPSLLEKFSGKCSLAGWLATVATNRWIDLKRKQARRAEVTGAGPDGKENNPLDGLPAATPAPREEPLVGILRDSLQAGFAQCRPEAMVLLRLVYLHELTQREIVRMLGWSESKVSRFLGRAMAEIESRTLQELKKRDPWLELGWQDFVDLCETHQVGFI